MKKIFIVVFVLFTCNLFPQTKYMIYFNDKGISPSIRLSKSSALFKLAEKELTASAIERRKQVMGEDEYITYEDIPLNETYLTQLSSAGIKIHNKLKWFNAVSAYLTDSQLEQIKKFSFVVKIEKIHIFKSQQEVIENVNGTNKQTNNASNVQSSLDLNYGPSLTQASLSEIPAIHNLGINGSNVLIGILDTGFRWKTNPSLKNLLVVNEKDFIQSDNTTENQSGDASNQDSHGTAVFSIIAGNDPGNIIGPAYGASFLLAKTEYVPTETNVEEDNYAAALEWMEGLGVQITTSSLGYNIFDPGQRSYTYAEMNGSTTIVAKAANLAFTRGVSTFTAAGNDGASFWGVGKGGLGSPGDAINMITVGAVDPNKNVTSFSSRGPTSDGRLKPEIVAQGSSVYHSNPGGAYSSGGGTSYATPIAAGIAGLLKSCWTHLTNVQIRNIFIACGDNTSTPNNDKGYGLISAKKAVAYPNLSGLNNVYRVLNKIFIDANGVNTSSVKIIYKIGNSSFQTVNMNYDGTLKYNFTFSSANNGDIVEFYFTYQNSNNASVREPAGVKNYKFILGSVDIITNVENKNEIPDKFYLSQNYPNPFNPSTNISWQIAVSSYVTLIVYDLLGREIATLVDGFKQAGIHNSTFNINNLALTSGVYYYTLKAGNNIQTKKMLLIK